MGGHNLSYLRGYCNGFSQDTQLSGWYLPHHHWRHRSYSLLHIKMSFDERITNIKVSVLEVTQ